MREAHVRQIVVKGTRYVQAVQYPTKIGEKFRVLQSFGVAGDENCLRAELYAAAYNALAKHMKGKSRHLDLTLAALATFCSILGLQTVEEILEAKPE